MPALMTCSMEDDGQLPQAGAAWRRVVDDSGAERLIGPQGIENVVLRRHEAPVARLILMPMDWPDQAMRQVSWAFVAPRHRGQGLARRLYLAAAQRHGAVLSDHYLSKDAFALWVRLMNEPGAAVDLYAPQSGAATAWDDPDFPIREMQSDWVYRLRYTVPAHTAPSVAEVIHAI